MAASQRLNVARIAAFTPAIDQRSLTQLLLIPEDDWYSVTHHCNLFDYVELLSLSKVPVELAFGFHA